ncbi:MAG: A24 family peptidase [Pseudomonadota bacterium]|nr:A24 family peptidase [Pseudomonadota bacterium]
MDLLDYLATQPELIILFSGILGLIVGSFLNVVIYRLPLMMEREWRTQCIEFLSQDASSAAPFPATEAPTAPFNLVTPRSQCPQCHHLITALENIPIFSFLWQKGRCNHCQHKISWRYPLLEFSSALIAMITAWQIGWGWPLLGALVLSWALVALTMIDIDHQLLPDQITLPLLWLGLLVNLFGLYTDLTASVIGAMVGYLSLWFVYWFFKLATGKEGMGFGDFKLVALLGAWLGWQQLPLIILLASFVGAAIGISLVLIRQHDKDVPFPFGPYLAAAGWISLLWGEQLTQLYLSWRLPL